MHLLFSFFFFTQIYVWYYIELILQPQNLVQQCATNHTLMLCKNFSTIGARVDLARVKSLTRVKGTRVNCARVKPGVSGARMPHLLATTTVT